MPIRQSVKLWTTVSSSMRKANGRKKQKKKQAKVVLKEIKFPSVRTGDHDFQFKLRHAP